MDFISKNIDKQGRGQVSTKTSVNSSLNFGGGFNSSETYINIEDGTNIDILLAKNIYINAGEEYTVSQSVANQISIIKSKILNNTTKVVTLTNNVAAIYRGIEYAAGELILKLPSYASLNTTIIPNKTHVLFELSDLFYIKDDAIVSDVSINSKKSVSAFGSATGGTGTVGFNRLDAWGDYLPEKSVYALSAGLGYDLNTRLGTAETTLQRASQL